MIRYKYSAAGRTAMTLDAHKDWTSQCCYSYDGHRIVSVSRDKTARLWDPHIGYRLATFSGHTDYVTGCSVGFDNEIFITTGGDGVVKIWDMRNHHWGKIASLRGHTDWATSCHHSPVEYRVVSGSRDKTVRVWDTSAASNVYTLQGHQWEVSSVRYSPDGAMIASGSWDRLVKLWDARGGKTPKIQTLDGHIDWVTNLAFSPDGFFLASCSTDRRVNVWDLRTNQILSRSSGHAFTVNDVVFSPSGQYLATASDDSTVKVWNTATGTELLNLMGHKGPVTGVDWCPTDARYLISSSRDKTVKLWDINIAREPLEEPTFSSSRLQEVPAPLPSPKVTFVPIAKPAMRDEHGEVFDQPLQSGLKKERDGIEVTESEDLDDLLESRPAPLGRGRSLSDSSHESPRNSPQRPDAPEETVPAVVKRVGDLVDSENSRRGSDQPSRRRKSHQVKMGTSSDTEPEKRPRVSPLTLPETQDPLKKRSSTKKKKKRQAESDTETKKSKRLKDDSRRSSRTEKVSSKKKRKKRFENLMAGTTEERTEEAAAEPTALQLFLIRHNLQQYEELILEAGFDGPDALQLLSEMTEADMKEIGITKLGHRRALQTALLGLRANFEPMPFLDGASSDEEPLSFRSNSSWSSQPSRLSGLSPSNLEELAGAGTPPNLLEDVTVGPTLRMIGMRFFFEKWCVGTWGSKKVLIKIIGSAFLTRYFPRNQFPAIIPRLEEVLRTIDHPNIVQFHGFCRLTTGQYALVVGIPSRNLNDWLEEQADLHQPGALPPAMNQQLYEIALDLASALEYMEQQQWAVGRISSVHVYLFHQEGDSRWQARLDVFSAIWIASLAAKLAGVIIPRTQPISPLDYPYCAPEMLLRHRFSLPGDVWGFCVLLWEMWNLAAAPYLSLLEQRAPDSVQKFINYITNPFSEKISVPSEPTIQAILSQGFEIDPSKRCRPCEIVEKLSSRLEMLDN